MAGGTLRHRIYDKTKPPLTTPEILAISIQVAKGIAHMHRRSLVHRDLKPENILLDASGTAKIADLGLAHQAGSLLDSNAVTDGVGSAGYMAPEQYEGHYTSKVDVYALGVILNECFCCQPPHGYGKQFLEIVHEVAIKGGRPEMCEAMPVAFQKLVQQCWDSDPLKRPAAKEVQIMLENINEQMLVEMPPVESKDKLAEALKSLKKLQFNPSNGQVVHMEEVPSLGASLTTSATMPNRGPAKCPGQPVLTKRFSV
mmetsp:Transcript_7811/g.22238  ORF Transcript_7811/g.22238 Transcript_7811/m.22238 type:complete len:256 (-) Transcript_7811:2728-3495(-)